MKRFGLRFCVCVCGEFVYFCRKKKLVRIDLNMERGMRQTENENVLAGNQKEKQKQKNGNVYKYAMEKEGGGRREAGIIVKK